MNGKLQNSLNAFAISAALAGLVLMVGTSPSPTAFPATTHVAGIPVGAAAAGAKTQPPAASPGRTHQRHSLVMPYFSFSPRG